MREMRTRVDTVNRSVEELQAAMDSIRDSSGAISKIIKTIDEIAFQTNILALNGQWKRPGPAKPVPDLPSSRKRCAASLRGRRRPPAKPVG